MNKWFSLSLGAVLGVTHIGLIGLIATNNRNSLPKIDIPVGDYTSYVVQASKEGYKISYKGNDPKTAYLTKDIKTKAGFLGLSNNTTKVAEEYFMDGKTNQGGPVSNQRSWIDSPPGLTQEQAAAISAERIACIKAVGSGEGTGRVVGTSVGAAAAPALSGIPFVGWVAAGWVAMFGGNQGAEIGGNMAEGMSKDC
jgi:hypothetical protein|tara:strand:+ start:381 stop:968 length:588 start_codon:yes stop_codon:yes gene_type:complete